MFGDGLSDRERKRQKQEEYKRQLDQQVAYKRKIKEKEDLEFRSDPNPVNNRQNNQTKQRIEYNPFDHLPPDPPVDRRKPRVNPYYQQSGDFFPTYTPSYTTPTKPYNDKQQEEKKLKQELLSLKKQNDDLVNEYNSSQKNYENVELREKINEQQKEINNLYKELNEIKQKSLRERSNSFEKNIPKNEHNSNGSSTNYEDRYPDNISQQPSETTAKSENSEITPFYQNPNKPPQYEPKYHPKFGSLNELTTPHIFQIRNEISILEKSLSNPSLQLSMKPDFESMSLKDLLSYKDYLKSQIITPRNNEKTNETMIVLKTNLLNNIRDMEEKLDMKNFSALSFHDLLKLELAPILEYQSFLNKQIKTPIGNITSFVPLANQPVIYSHSPIKPGVNHDQSVGTDSIIGNDKDPKMVPPYISDLWQNKSTNTSFNFNVDIQTPPNSELPNSKLQRTLNEVIDDQKPKSTNTSSNTDSSPFLIQNELPIMNFIPDQEEYSPENTLTKKTNHTMKKNPKTKYNNDNEHYEIDDVTQRKTSDDKITPLKTQPLSYHEKDNKPINTLESTIVPNNYNHTETLNKLFSEVDELEKKLPQNKQHLKKDNFKESSIQELVEYYHILKENVEDYQPQDNSKKKTHKKSASQSSYRSEDSINYPNDFLQNDKFSRSGEIKINDKSKKNRPSLDSVGSNSNLIRNPTSQKSSTNENKNKSTSDDRTTPKNEIYSKKDGTPLTKIDSKLNEQIEDFINHELSYNTNDFIPDNPKELKRMTRAVNETIPKTNGTHTFLNEIESKYPPYLSGNLSIDDLLKAISQLEDELSIDKTDNRNKNVNELILYHNKLSQERNDKVTQLKQEIIGLEKQMDQTNIKYSKFSISQAFENTSVQELEYEKSEYLRQLSENQLHKKLNGVKRRPKKNPIKIHKNSSSDDSSDDLTVSTHPCIDHAILKSEVDSISKDFDKFMEEHKISYPPSINPSNNIINQTINNEDMDKLFNNIDSHINTTISRVKYNYDKTLQEIELNKTKYLIELKKLYKYNPQNSNSTANNSSNTKESMIKFMNKSEGKLNEFIQSHEIKLSDANIKDFHNKINSIKKQSKNSIRLVNYINYKKESQSAEIHFIDEHKTINEGIMGEFNLLIDRLKLKQNKYYQL